jgi:hypothetical protein
MPQTEPGLGILGPRRTRICRPGARRRTVRPKAGHCMWLDIDRLIGQGILQPGSRRQGAIAWRDAIACEYTTVDRARGRTGEYVCSVGFDADLEEPATTTVRLSYCVHDPATGNLRGVEQLVGMAWIYGELWFVDNGRRSKRLCLPPNGARFACPQAWGVRYKSPNPGQAGAARHSRCPGSRLPAEFGDSNWSCRVAPPKTAGGWHVRPPPGSRETPAIRPSANDGKPSSTDPVADTSGTGSSADKRSAKSHAEQTGSCGRQSEEADEGKDSHPAFGRSCAWLLTKITKVKRAFIGNHCRRTHRNPCSTKTARANREHGLVTKFAQAKDVAKECVSRFWETIIVPSAHALGRPFAWIGGRLLARRSTARFLDRRFPTRASPER